MYVIQAEGGPVKVGVRLAAPSEAVALISRKRKVEAEA